ncbi:MAG: EF2563 family selenium-dependent molybdenum hydroxylase system protein [Lachnospiraceae bacterium]|jgi:xanthine dehydrogenase accessory factor|nr:EF2563 family selenium-dependent molybdenum hydroxylase system protein [Lachnospiraceae bacterium]
MRDLIIVRGGGDLATGAVQKFYRAGFRVLVLETGNPTTIRRTVSLSEAIFSGYSEVEDLRCRKIESVSQIEDTWKKREIPIMVDPSGASIYMLKPRGVIDAIIAKKNLGTNREMAEITIGLGPGFTAGIDVDAVIETKRGHTLGKVIFEGRAIENTGVPGIVEGYGKERVIHAPTYGKLLPEKSIGDKVLKGEILFFIENENEKKGVAAPFSGLLRGLINPKIPIKKGLKIADIDPRIDANWKTISDKARAVGGGALEAYLYLRNNKGGNHGLGCT